MSGIATLIVLLIAVAMYFWYITLPVYVAIIWLQFFMARRIEDRGANPGFMRTVAILQIVCLVLPVILYPFMPGRTRTNEPLGMNEKAACTALITVALIALGIALNVVACVTGFAKTRKMKAANQRFEAIGDPGSPQPQP